MLLRKNRIHSCWWQLPRLNSHSHAHLYCAAADFAAAGDKFFFVQPMRTPIAAQYSAAIAADVRSVARYLDFSVDVATWQSCSRFFIALVEVCQLAYHCYIWLDCTALGLWKRPEYLALAAYTVRSGDELIGKKLLLLLQFARLSGYSLSFSLSFCAYC